MEMRTFEPDAPAAKPKYPTQNATALNSAAVTTTPAISLPRMYFAPALSSVDRTSPLSGASPLPGSSETINSLPTCPESTWMRGGRGTAPGHARTLNPVEGRGPGQTPARKVGKLKIANC